MAGIRDVHAQNVVGVGKTRSGAYIVEVSAEIIRTRVDIGRARYSHQTVTMLQIIYTHTQLIHLAYSESRHGGANKSSKLHVSPTPYILMSVNTFSLIGSYSVEIVYQPRQTTLHLWDVSEKCYREPT